MLIPFFYLLRDGGMKPSITELLTLLEAMKRGVAGQSVDDFYYLARSCLVKDESQIDRFDRIFAAYFHGIEDTFADLMQDGIALAGGGALLRGLAERLSEDTRMNVYVAEDPMTCVAQGAERILENIDVLRKVLASMDRGSTLH